MTSINLKFKDKSAIYIFLPISNYTMHTYMYNNTTYYVYSDVLILINYFCFVCYITKKNKNFRTIKHEHRNYISAKTNNNLCDMP